MTLSVVTIVKDRTVHLLNLVEGLRRGQRRPDELIVVRMGGEDPTPHLPDPGFAVRTEHLDDVDGLPLARARNRGVEVAHGDDVVLLDVDCIPGSHLVRAYADALVRRDALLMGDVRYLEPAAAEGGWTEASLRASSRPHPTRPERPAGLHETDRYDLFWSLSFAVRRVTFLDAIGGFDLELDGYGGEDTDFAFAARAADVPLAWLGAAATYHQHHVTHAPPLQHLASIVPNARRFREKWGTWPMEGWLRAFQELGLVRWEQEGGVLEIVREPSASELAATRRDQVVPAPQAATDDSVA